MNILLGISVSFFQSKCQNPGYCFVLSLLRCSPAKRKFDNITLTFEPDGEAGVYFKDASVCLSVWRNSNEMLREKQINKEERIICPSSKERPSQPHSSQMTDVLCGKHDSK